MSYHQPSDYIEALHQLLRQQQRNIALQYQLQAIHLQIIGYLARCNRFSDSFRALCDYLQQSKGSLSQSVTLLEQREILEKIPSAGDQRKLHLRLTPLGRRIARAQQAPWQKALGDNAEQLLAGFDSLIQQLHPERNFGSCGHCKFLDQQQQRAYCQQLKETLAPVDTEKLCQHFKATEL